jgi:hypothetical protein
MITDFCRSEYEFLLTCKIILQDVGMLYSPRIMSREVNITLYQRTFLGTSSPWKLAHSLHDIAGRWFSPATLVSCINKTDCHDIAEILLKVALSTINQTILHRAMESIGKRDFQLLKILRPTHLVVFSLC